MLTIGENVGTRETHVPLERKLLERIKGFFNHFAIIYDTIIPFLKGFHNTIDGWRNNKDEEAGKRREALGKGFLTKLFEDKITEEEHELLAIENGCNCDPPKTAMPIPRLFDDIEMLLRLLKN